MCQSLWHRRFPVNFAKFVITPFLIDHLRWLLLAGSYSKTKLLKKFVVTGKTPFFVMVPFYTLRSNCLKICF